MTTELSRLKTEAVPSIEDEPPSRYCLHWCACKRHVWQRLYLKDTCCTVWLTTLETILARPSGRSSLIPQKTMEMKANMHTNVWISMAAVGLFLFTGVNDPSNKGCGLRCWYPGKLDGFHANTYRLGFNSNRKSQKRGLRTKTMEVVNRAKEHTLNYDICK